MCEHLKYMPKSIDRMLNIIILVINEKLKHVHLVKEKEQLLYLNHMHISFVLDTVTQIFFGVNQAMLDSDRLICWSPITNKL